MTVLRAFERLEGATGTHDLVDIGLSANRMNLPQIHIIRLEQTEGGFEVQRRLICRAFPGLGGEENILPSAVKADAVGLFGKPAPISVRAIEVGHAEVVDGANVGGGCRDVRMKIHAGSALSADADLNAGLAEYGSGNVAGFDFLRHGKRSRYHMRHWEKRHRLVPPKQFRPPLPGGRSL